MNKINLLCISLMSLILVTTSCNDCTKGTGNVTSIDRSLPAFNSVRIKGGYRAYLIRDSIHFVTISADDNILPLIETKVHNGILEVGETDDKCIKNSHRSDIYIHTPSLQNLTLEGSGSVNTEQRFSGNTLKITIKGSGDVRAEYEGNSVEAIIEGSGNIHLQGAANEGKYTISGSGYIHAEQMSVRESQSKISGSGNMDVNSSSTLDVNISGSGTIWYSGNPAIQTNISGSGKVVRK